MDAQYIYIYMYAIHVYICMLYIYISINSHHIELLSEYYIIVISQLFNFCSTTLDIARQYKNSVLTSSNDPSYIEFVQLY